jgi:hypothetical protein
MLFDAVVAKDMNAQQKQAMCLLQCMNWSALLLLLQLLQYHSALLTMNLAMHLQRLMSDLIESVWQGTSWTKKTNEKSSQHKLQEICQRKQKEVFVC